MVSSVNFYDEYPVYVNVHVLIPHAHANENVQPFRFLHVYENGDYHHVIRNKLLFYYSVATHTWSTSGFDFCCIM